MKKIYLISFLLISFLIGIKAQPSSTNIPNPATDTNIIPSSAFTLVLYSADSKLGPFNTTEGTVTIADYGDGNEGVKVTASTWQTAYIDLGSNPVDLNSGAGRYQQIYFVYAGALNSAMFYSEANDGSWNEISITSRILTNGWTLGIANIPDEAALLDNVRFQINSEVGSEFYVANVCLAGFGVPTNQLTPPDREAGTYMSLYSNKYGDQGNWSAGAGSQENYDINGNANTNCRKITLSPESWGANAQITLSPTQDLNNYTHVHFDLWLVDELEDDKIRIELFPPVAPPIGENDNYQCLQKSIPATSTTKTWIGFDWALDDFIANGYLGWTASRIKENFERFSFSATSSTAFTSKTFYVDNIYFYTISTDVTIPKAPAYLPPVISNPDNVVSLFGNSYASVTETPTITPEADTIQVKNDDIWKFENTDNIQLTFPEINISGMTHVHVDIWTETNSSFNISLNSITTHYAAQTTAGEWLQLDIPVSYFQEALNTFTSLKISGDNNNYFIDNVYFYKDLPQFTVDIKTFNANLEKGINLGDIFDFEGENWNPDYLKMIADSGFAHVRLPVNWENYSRSMDTAPYNIEPEFMHTIQEIVDLAIAENLKIIVNMHHHRSVQADPNGQKERFMAQWQQIAGYFRYYPDNLIFEIFNEPYGNDNDSNSNIYPDVWNELLVDGLNTIRATNPNRPVMIGTAEGGGISGLKYLELPASDENLIITIHYYNPSDFTHQGAEWAGPTPPPVGTEWLDTESDRDNVISDFQQITDYLQLPGNEDRPIHIGEFGVIYKADMDSRVRWTTYVARYIESQPGYSWAYWEFDAKFGIYDPISEVYRQPLVDALLRNPMPENPAKYEIITTDVLYDSNETGTSTFTGYGYDNISYDNNELVVNISNGRSEIYDVQVYKQQELQEGVAYRVSFTVSVNADNDFRYQAYCFDQESPSYTKFSEIISFVPTTEPVSFSYEFQMPEDNVEKAWIAFDLGGSETTPVTITLSNIKIEEIESRLEAAPKPELTADKIDNIYSSFYTNSKAITYSNMEQVSNITDADNGLVTLFTDFDNQLITLPENLFPGNKKTLHLEAYAGSPLNMEVSLYGNISETKSYTLPSHEWTSLDIDLSDILTDGSYINSIKLSGGTGSGRKLYFDHMYFYGDQTVGLETTETNNIQIYSNDGNIYVTSHNPMQEITIYDVQGKMLIKKTSLSGTFYQIPVQGLTPSMLIIEVTTNNGTQKFKVIR